MRSGSQGDTPTAAHVHGDDEACRLLAQQLKEEGFNASAPMAEKVSIG